MAKKILPRYETKQQPLIPRPAFLRRLAWSFAFTLGLVAASLAAGMAGYRHFEEMTWIDAFANAAMILSGMGPLEPLKTVGGKLFAGCFALYSGLVVVVAAGVLFAPVIHRMLHKFHVGSGQK